MSEWLQGLRTKPLLLTSSEIHVILLSDEEELD